MKPSELEKDEKRYFIDRSESGDYYCIPVELKNEWKHWKYEGYAEFDAPPKGVFYIGGHTNCVTFTNPKKIS